MPRIAMETSGTGIYHVMLRGINRQDIFEDAEDYWTFVRILGAVQGGGAGGTGLRVTSCAHQPVPASTPASTLYAYCLMPNHVHLLLFEKQWRVGEVVKSIAASYVFHYNKKYGRVGHLFQDRFRSEPCNDSGCSAGGECQWGQVGESHLVLANLSPWHVALA